MRVEIWSDVVCPWCYIGKRKFEAALASYEGDETFEIVSSVAAGVGLNFDMDHALRANTMDANRLIGQALSGGGPEMQSAMKERLLKAYFNEGRNIGDVATLSEASEAQDAMPEGDAEACRVDARPES